MASDDENDADALSIRTELPTYQPSAPSGIPRPCSPTPSYRTTQSVTPGDDSQQGRKKSDPFATPRALSPTPSYCTTLSTRGDKKPRRTSRSSSNNDLSVYPFYTRFPALPYESTETAAVKAQEAAISERELHIQISKPTKIFQRLSNSIKRSSEVVTKALDQNPTDWSSIDGLLSNESAARTLDVFDLIKIMYYTTHANSWPYERTAAQLYSARDLVLLKILHMSYFDARRAYFAGGQTLLHLAVQQQGNMNTIDILTHEKGHRKMDKNVQDDMGRTPLHLIVAMECRTEYIDALYNHKGGLVTDKNLDTPLHVFARENAAIPHASNVVHKLKFQSDPNARNARNETALTLAIRNRAVETVQELFLNDPCFLEEIDDGRAFIDSSTFIAAGNDMSWFVREVLMVQFHIRVHRDIYEDIEVMSLLKVSSPHRDLKKLLEFSFQRHGPDQDLPLYDAVFKHEPEAVKILQVYTHPELGLGKDSYGRTSLHLVAGRMQSFYRAKEENAWFVKHLLRHGADVNARDTLGRTPLHYAYATAQNGMLPIGNTGVVRDLIQAGADPYLRDDNDETPVYLRQRLERLGQLRRSEWDRGWFKSLHVDELETVK